MRSEGAICKFGGRGVDFYEKREKKKKTKVAGIKLKINCLHASSKEKEEVKMN